MPAYSFKEPLVPFVEDGSKPHTIRSRRKNPAKPGDTLYLYYGLRTKHCRKLREEICTRVKTIIITESNIVLVNDRLNDADYEFIKQNPDNLYQLDKHEFEILTDRERNVIAWRDGIRPTNKPSPGCFETMVRFFSQMHSLPFIGDIIYWNPK